MGKRKSKQKGQQSSTDSESGRPSEILTVDEAFARGDYATVVAMRDKIVSSGEDHLTKEVRESYGSLELDPGVIKLSAALVVMYAIGWVVAVL